MTPGFNTSEVAEIRRGSVQGILHRPLQPSGNGLVLTHGAGANCHAPLLLTIANAFCASGMHVLRCDLPFRQKRPSGPPSPATARSDRDGLRDATSVLREYASGRIFLGGHSYGGRQSSMLASEVPDVADALLLLSYPLHPPKKPAEKRTAHFDKLVTPALFVHGTKDPFGTVHEMEEALRLIPASHKLVLIQGAGHDLRTARFNFDELPETLQSLV